MPGLNGRTRTLRLSTNVRIAKYAVLLMDPTDTTQTAWYCKQPPSATPWTNAEVAGVAINYLVEPNFFPGYDPDPTTVTGTTPVSPYVLGGTGVQQPGPGITLQYDGMCRCQAGAGTINSGDILVVADQYGRVNTPANLGIVPGTYIFQVGIAMGKTTAINQIIFCTVMPMRIIA